MAYEILDDETLWIHLDLTKKTARDTYKVYNKLCDQVRDIWDEIHRRGNYEDA